MYGGAAVQSNHHTMNSASPIPQQWWEQDGQGQAPGGYGGPSSRAQGTPTRPGMSAMDIAASSPSLSQRMNGLGISGGGGGTHTPSTPMNGNAPPPPPQRGPSSNGLIRLTLKKPMGIVFEPMEDPHNPSQQRGVRICDLPRTGAAALSGMLEVGDELLSLNNKTMSRLTFDEIMDFIIDADAENVDLLFRRPKKDRNGMGKISDATKAKNSAVKWDENVTNTVGTIDTLDTGNDDTTLDEETQDSGNHRRSPPRRGNSNRDEESLYSGDETFYTEQTSVYTEDTRNNKKRGKNRRRRYESESFLDLLIDTVCAPMIGGRDGKSGDYSDDDMTFNSMDEDTYASGDESYTYLEEKKKKWQESRKKRSEREKKSLEDEKKKKSKKKPEKARSSPKEKPYEPENVPPYEQEQPPAMPYARGGAETHRHPYEAQNPVPYMEHQNPEILGVPDMNVPLHAHPHDMRQTGPPNSPPRRSSAKMGGAHDGMNMDMNLPPKTPSPQRRSNTPSPRKKSVYGAGPSPGAGNGVAQPNSPQNGLDAEVKMPFNEITYDDQVDENVSVMESVGGPSLLLENLRNVQLVQRTVEPDIIAKYGKDFKPDLGLTREESIQMNPDKFYKHAVKVILQKNEPEKVRLMDKLFDKYRGREEHLIRKLGARYAASNPSESMDNVKSTSSDGAYDGFKAFGGGDFSSGSNDKPAMIGSVDENAWQSQDIPAFAQSTTNDSMPDDNGGSMYGDFGADIASNNQDRGRHDVQEVDADEPDDDHSSYTESDYDSLDGTSPEVIAQVSELLNYVYGKTTVAGQIDRVSTIMRAYEGREAILLELLETKALLKANNENGSIEDLPESLKDNPGLQNNPSEVKVEGNKMMVSPISQMTNPSAQASSMASPPPHPLQQRQQPPRPQQNLPDHHSISTDSNPFNIDNRHQQAPTYSSDKKKKKGFFGRFKKKKGKGGEFPTSESARKNRGKSGALLGGE